MLPKRRNRRTNMHVFVAALLLKPIEQLACLALVYHTRRKGHAAQIHRANVSEIHRADQGDLHALTEWLPNM